MPKGSSSGDFNRAMRKAQSQADSAAKRAQRGAQRQAEASTKRTNPTSAERMEKAIKEGNRDAERRTRRLQNRAANGAVSQPEHELLQQFQDSLAEQPAKDNDLFLSYTRSDGWQVAGFLYESLREQGVTVWFDARGLRLGPARPCRWTAA